MNGIAARREQEAKIKQAAAERRAAAEDRIKTLFGGRQDGMQRVSHESGLASPMARQMHAEGIRDVLNNDRQGTLDMLVHMRQQLMQGEGGTDLLNQYLTVLVALGGTDPGGTYNLMRPDTFRETADYALSASIGDLYIKAAVGNTLGAGNENLQVMLLSRENPLAPSALHQALIDGNGLLRQDSAGFGRIGPATQAAISEQDLRNSSILRNIYQGGVNFEGNTSRAYTNVTIDGVTKRIDFQATFASSLWPQNATLAQQREQNLRSIQGVRPDAYVALLRGMYADNTITGVELSGGLRPASAGGAHPVGRGLDVTTLYTTTGVVNLDNSGYRIENGNGGTFRGVPISPFGSAQQRTTANNFIRNVSSANGVNPNQVFHPGQEMNNLQVPPTRVGTNVQQSDLTTRAQRNTWIHRNHLHIGMQPEFRTPMPLTQPWLEVQPNYGQWI